MKSKSKLDFGLYKYAKESKHKLFMKIGAIVTISAIVTCGVTYTLFMILGNVNSITFFANTAINETKVEFENESFESLANDSFSAAKLVSREIGYDQYQKSEYPPRPFGNTVRGLPPTAFVGTQKSTTTFPQLNTYRNQGHPRNIQEILSYISNTEKVNQPSSQRYNYNAHAPSNQYGQTFYPSADAFNTYKPQDPSDINLLAKSSFRFAPPLWSNFMKSYPKIMSQMTQQHEKITPTEKPKSLSLVLNVFPVGGEYRIIAQPSGGERAPRNGYLEELKARNIRPKKILLYINLYEADLEKLDETNGNLEQ